MAYASEADLDAGWSKRLIDLLTVDDVTLARDDARINSALEEATAMVNSYVSRRHTMPLSLTSDGIILLRKCTVDLAVGQLAVSADLMSDIIQTRQDQALAFLKDVVGGKANVAVVSTAGSTGPAITPNEAVIEGPERLFTRDKLRGL